MATDFNTYYPIHPGYEQAGPVSNRAMYAPTELALGYFAANEHAQHEGKKTLLNFGAYPYLAARYTETKDNSATISYAAGGLQLAVQATPSDNDDVCVTSVETATIAQDKVHSAMVRLQVSSAANFGFTFGFATSGSTELFTADPADGLFLVKAKNAATVVGRVRDNSGTAANSGTLATLADATDVVLAFRFKAGASAAASWGKWYVGTVSAVTGTTSFVETNFTSAQVTAVRAILATTPATFAAQLGFRVNSTTQRSALIQYALAEVDR